MKRRGIITITKEQLKTALDEKRNWNFYIGCMWSLLFCKINLPKKAVLIEIAPGAENKIGSGLILYEFEGTIYIVEPNRDALKKITRRYKESLKKAKIIPVQSELRYCLPFLPKKVDAVLSNHVLDDLILGKSLTNSEFNNYFRENYGISAEKTKMLWNKIDLKPEKIEKIKSEIFEEYERLFKSTNPNFAIFSEYESYYFKQKGITQPDKHAFDVLKKIREKYFKKCIKIPLSLRKYIENPERWLIVKFKK